MSLRGIAKASILSACQYLGVNSMARNRMRRQLLVLAYHGVVSSYQTDRIRYATTVSVAEFDEHLRVLRKSFWKPMAQAPEIGHCSPVACKAYGN